MPSRDDIRASVRRHISKRVGDLYAPPKPGADPNLFQQNEPNLCDDCGHELRCQNHNDSRCTMNRETCSLAWDCCLTCECEPAERGYDDALGAKCDAEARQEE